MIMRKLKLTTLIPLGLVSLGLTPALESAAIADPGGRYGPRERRSGALQLNKDYFLHKRSYAKDQDRDHKIGSAPGRKVGSGRAASERYHPDSAGLVLYRVRTGALEI
jgi:hypothetical protein